MYIFVVFGLYLCTVCLFMCSHSVLCVYFAYICVFYSVYVLLFLFVLPSPIYVTCFLMSGGLSFRGSYALIGIKGGSALAEEVQN